MIAAAFWKHAQAFYVHPDGSSTGKPRTIELCSVHSADCSVQCRPTNFGPKCLKTLREAVLRPQEETDARDGFEVDAPGLVAELCQPADRSRQDDFRWAASEE